MALLLLFTLFTATCIVYVLSHITRFKNNIALVSSISITASIISLAIAASLLIEHQETPGNLLSNYGEWIKVYSYSVHWELQVDTLSAVMNLVILCILGIVQFYSYAYMAKRENIARYYSYLCLFGFFMVFLVMSPNLLQFFIGWEGVGVCSFLLIGFQHQKLSSTDAAYKAFIINRVGDVGYLAGLVLYFYTFDSLSFGELTSAPLLHSTSALFMGGCFIFGAMAKSAQFGLHTWLPDAMEGPTPASALIHAATMVTAGIFLLLRLSPIIDTHALLQHALIIIGFITAIYAGARALIQDGIKKVVAYSTISQLGLMVVACGLGYYHVAFFHLVMHAFFKALLFLSVGSVTYSFSNERILTHMGGAWRLIPYTCIYFHIATFALCGLPLLNGYYSKKMLAMATLAANSYQVGFAFYSLLIALLFTAMYSARILYLIFYGSVRADEKVKALIKEAPFSMQLSNILLCTLVIFGGIVGQRYLLDPSFYEASILFTPIDISLISKSSILITTILPLTLLLVIIIHGKRIFKERGNPIWKKIKLTISRANMSALISMLVLKPFNAFASFLYSGIEKGGIERFGPRGIVKFSFWLAQKLRKFHSGLLRHYLIATLIGVFGLFFWTKYCR